MVFENDWSLYFKYPTLQAAKGAIPSVAKAHTEYTKFKVVRFDENVILQLDREHALNPT